MIDTKYYDAISAGNLEQLKSLAPHRAFEDTDLERAINAGHLLIVKYFLNNHPYNILDKDIQRASDLKHKDIANFLKWEKRLCKISAFAFKLLLSTLIALTITGGLLHVSLDLIFLISNPALKSLLCFTVPFVIFTLHSELFYRLKNISKEILAPFRFTLELG